MKLESWARARILVFCMLIGGVAVSYISHQMEQVGQNSWVAGRGIWRKDKLGETTSKGLF